MILTDREIRTAIKRGVIVIDPPPSENAYSSTSVDLTLDHELTLFKDDIDGTGIEMILDPSNRRVDTEKALESITSKATIHDDGYVLKSNKLVLAYTKEYVDLRIDTKYAARVEGKSSLARYGLSIHITAPTIHAGFDGRIRLEMLNHGPLPIRLRKGMPICQLIFEQTLGTPDKGYSGQFAGQGGS
ncbi:dCTP deaminase [Methylocystis bryophila]|uniref:dCTP deaminase n=1 Tax=Methylocystis bryophila TaxID=655015 RepID=A0A1W6MRS0_9HYPH|nr:dCTP deaminase [Methylocystis bryophila]ARN80310.1 dCTP deaminase [Methylocystis bryophila]BDV40287.1 dCTP deaminase [Methylocystis bryophila]